MTTDEFAERMAAVRARVLAPGDLPERIRDRIAAEARLEAEREAELARRSRWALLKGLGIPQDHWDRLEAPEDRAPLAAAREFLAATGPKTNIVVLGGVGGVGKSFAAAWAVHEAAFTEHNGTRVHRGGTFMVSAPEMSKRGAFDRDFWNALASMRLLAIDELGQEPQDAGGWLAGCLFDLFNSRCGGDKKTIVTTNLAGKDFMARYADGNFDRLKRRWEDFGSFKAFAEREPGSEG